jgi:hypothetical protein
MALSQLRSEAVLYGCLSFCALSVASAQRVTVFRGFITDSAHVAIAGVEVTMLEAHRVARTDSAGVFVFRGYRPAPTTLSSVTHSITLSMVQCGSLRAIRSSIECRACGASRLRSTRCAFTKQA